MTSIDRINHYFSEIRRLRKEVFHYVSGQYTKLHRVGDLHNHPKVNAFEKVDEKNKTFRDNAKKAIKNSMDMEIKEANVFDELIFNVEKLIEIIPAPFSGELNDIKNEMEVYHTETTSLLSNGGDFEHLLNSIIEDRATHNFKILEVELADKLKVFTDETLVPFLAILKTLDTYCFKEAEIIRVVKDNITLKISFLFKEGKNPDLILMDSSFLDSLLKQKEHQKKELVELKFPNNPIKQYPSKILDEINRFNIQVAKETLDKSNFEEVDVKAKKPEIAEALKIFINAKIDEPEDSLDINLLVLALRYAKKKSTIVILTENKNIIRAIQRAKDLEEKMRFPPVWRYVTCNSYK